tara:strand:+ start:256 stop:399 length:144 start_codon:yes stop_codon:yes gene_type:complete
MYFCKKQIMKKIIYYSILVFILSILSACATSEQCPGVGKIKIEQNKA